MFVQVNSTYIITWTQANSVIYKQELWWNYVNKLKTFYVELTLKLIQIYCAFLKL